MSDGLTTTEEEAKEVPSPKLSQQSYRPTGFSQSDWEVVGKMSDEYFFDPIDIEVFSTAVLAVDPMFADYGSGKEAAGIRRWSSGSSEVLDKEAVKPTVPLEELNIKVQEAEERGRVQALEEAKVLREEEIKKMSETFAVTLKDIEQKGIDILLQIEKKAAQLAVDISKKILEQAVEINPEYIVEIIKQALGLAGSASIAKVKVSPQDMEFIEVMGIARMLKEYDGTWLFEADEGIKSGCVVETSAGVVDFQLDQAWERVAGNVVRVI